MSNLTVCSVEECQAPIKARGLCGAHYQRMRKTGDPLGVRPGRWDGYTKPLCSVGCGRQAHAGGLCSVHAPRLRRHGDPLAGRREEWAGSLVEFVLAFIDVREDGCWWWMGGRMGKYGSVNIPGAPQQYAHRIAHEIWVGEIGTGKTVHHRCENPSCVNPDHLVALTHKEHRQEHRRLRLAKLVAKEWSEGV